MRWPYKPKTEFDRIKKRFALFPLRVEEEWTWLEIYYSFSWEDYGGPNVKRFHSREEAVEWLETSWLG
jgi:hypothetical protein